MNIERKPQVYHAGEGDVIEDLSKSNLKLIPYQGQLDISTIMNIEKNVNTRVATLLGYRNERAIEADNFAKVARLEIMLDELRVAGFAFNPNSGQTPA